MNERIISLALPAGTVLRRGSDRYILGEVTSFGGSSLFYTAKKEGSALRFGIKECCPMDLAGRLRREGGILTGTDDQAKYALTQARTRMLGEAEISQKVAAVSAKTIPVWEAPGDLTVETAAGSAPAPAGSYLILRDVSRTGMFLPQLLAECALPPEEGHPLRTGGRPSLHTTARILAETLRALELVYQAGYLYGDVQPGNIFFADARPEKGDIGFVCLLDFGCARPLRDRKGGGKETAPITDRMVFSTPGYTAPEITWYNDGTLRLTPAADVYSAGRLLLFLLRGRTYFENGRDRMLSEGVTLLRLLPHEGERLGCTGESLRLLQSLLDRSLAPDPGNRFETAGEMLAEAEKLVDLTRPPNNQLALSFSALTDEEFLPREEQLAEIDRRLRRRCKPVILWGFAGMGKTELALKFAQRYTRGQAYFVRFRNSVRETVTGPIADAFSGYDRRDVYGLEKPEEQIYREVMKLLGERSENDLLILDNMDGGEGCFDVLRGEPAFRDLCALPMGLLVTTRSPAEEGMEVDALPPALLRQLLRRFADLSDEMADALINAVEGHTLTVELLGRTLKYSLPRLSPEALLEKLTRGDLDSEALARVSSPKDREWKAQRVQRHLTKLFSLAALPEKERRLLFFALLLPKTGLDADLFCLYPLFDQDALNHLKDRGFVRISRDGLVTAHPLVQSVGWSTLDTISALQAESEYATSYGCFLAHGIVSMWFSPVPQDGTRYCTQLLALADHLWQKMYDPLEEKNEKKRKFIAPEEDNRRLAWNKGVVAAIAGMCQEYCVGYSQRTVFWWEQAVASLKRAGSETERLLLIECLIKLAAAKERCLPGGKDYDIWELLKEAEKLLKCSYPRHSYPRHKAAIEYSRCRLAMRREDDKRSWKTAINAGKRALRYLSEASGSENCHFVVIPDPLEMELMIAQCQMQLGETASAAEAAQTALHAAEGNGMNRYSREACELLQKISAAQKDWDGALRWGKRAVRYGDGTYRDYREGVFHFPISVQLPPLELCAEACRYLGRDEEERAYILRIKALKESQERFGADRQDG